MSSPASLVFIILFMWWLQKIYTYSCGTLIYLMMRAVTSSKGADVGKAKNCSRYSWKTGYFDSFITREAAT